MAAEAAASTNQVPTVVGGGGDVKKLAYGERIKAEYVEFMKEAKVGVLDPDGGREITSLIKELEDHLVTAAEWDAWRTAVVTLLRHDIILPPECRANSFIDLGRICDSLFPATDARSKTTRAILARPQPK
jgi:hypothetical protein